MRLYLGEFPLTSLNLTSKMNKLVEFENINQSDSKLAISSRYFVLSNKNDVILWNIGDEAANQGIHLRGHHNVVTAVTISSCHDNQVIATGSSDYIIMWIVSELLLSHHNGESPRGHIFTSSSISPTFLKFSPNMEFLCYITDTTVIVWNYDLKEVVFEESCDGISAADFSGPNQLITATDCGWVYIWDVLLRTLVWKSSTQHGAGISSVAGRDSMRFIVASTNNVIYEYLSEHGVYMEKDLDQCLWHKFPDVKQLRGDETKDIVLSLLYVKSIHCDVTKFVEGEWVVCCTECAAYLVNCGSQDVIVMSYFDCDVGPPVMSQVALSQDPTTMKVYCAATYKYQPKFILYEVELPQPTSDPGINILSNTPLVDSSPLKGQVKFMPGTTPTKDQPITFKKKVKSSGYTSAPRMTMFKPTTTQPRKPKKLPESDKPSEPSDWSAPITSQRELSCTSEATFVRSIATNGVKHQIACVFGNHVTQVMSLPLLPSSVKPVTGASHTKGAYWSHGNNELLTYSDTTVSVWRPPYSGNPALEFPCQVKGLSKKEITSAQFYYVDKFILISVGDSLCLYKYHLHNGVVDDVKRYLAKGRVKLVGSWKSTSAQNILDFDAANNFYSYIAMCSGSDRSIQAFDFNVCKTAIQYDDVHTRASHLVKLCSGSARVTPASCDLFITSAVSDGVKLWDLRTHRSVHKFNLHSNNQKCDSCMTPCGKYLATTTDDKLVYIYDHRSHLPMHKVKLKFRPTTVAFTPSSTQLIIGGESSMMSCYSCR